MRHKLMTVLASGALLGLAGSVQAATKTQNFNVSATVVANCVIAAEPINFGNFDGTADLTADGDITVRCTNGTGYEVELSTGSSGDFAARTMLNGANSLVYNLYTTAGLATVWGDGSTGGTGSVSGSGTGMSAAQTKTHTVWGELLAVDNADAVPGAYLDTITATIVY